MKSCTVKLPDVCDIQYGYAFNSKNFSSTGKTPLIRIRDVLRGFSETYTNEEFADNYKVVDGDILVGMDGEFNIARWHGGDAALNQRVCKLIPSNKIDGQYLLYSMISALKQIEDRTSFVTVKHLSAKELNNISLILPELQIQENLVAKLDKISDIISRKEKLIELLDKLVKSRFVEMFGDPVTNPMGWETGTLADVIRTKASNGFFAKRNSYKNDGNVAVLGVADVVNRMYSKTTGLPRTDATDLDIKKYRVEYGDVLFCRSSLVQAGIGKASIVPRDISENILFECHVIRLQLDMNKCIPEFIQLLTTTDYCRNQIMAESKTATMTTIGQEGILRTRIYVPPLKLQNEFLSFVALADKSKFAVQQSIDTLQTLKSKLMQDYFG